MAMTGPSDRAELVSNCDAQLDALRVHLVEGFLGIRLTGGLRHVGERFQLAEAKVHANRKLPGTDRLVTGTGAGTCLLLAQRIGTAASSLN